MTNEAFEKIDGDNSKYLIICDHASNSIPHDYSNLGLCETELARHIAWDPGAKGTAQEMAKILSAPLICSKFSRLLIDPNRSEDDPTLIRRIYDGTIIPGNHHLDLAGREERLNRFYRPYHQAIDDHLDRHKDTTLISIHSFTPYLRDNELRPWHIGILWDQDDRIANPMLGMFSEDPEVCVGDNEPYSGRLYGDCMWMHGTDRGLRHVLIEFRNDIISTADQQQTWAQKVGCILENIE